MVFNTIDGNRWVDYTEEPDEQKIVVFKTGEEPDEIPLVNIHYSYPLPNQLNYYKGESTQGYVKLIQMQDRPLTLPDGFHYELRMLQNSNVIFTDQNVRISKNLNSRNVLYTIPNHLLTNENQYELQVVKVPNANYSEFSNVTSRSKIFNMRGLSSDDSIPMNDLTQEGSFDDISGASDFMEIRKRQASGSVIAPEDIVILKLRFRTSKFDDFQTKLSALKVVNPTYEYNQFNVLTPMKGGVEAFGPQEITRKEVKVGYYRYPAIRFDAPSMEGDRHDRYVRPLIYTAQNISRIDWREVPLFGTPPYRAIVINQDQPEIELQDGVNTYGYNSLKVNYKIDQVMVSDFNHIRATYATELFELLYDARDTEARTDIKVSLKGQSDLSHLKQDLASILTHKYESLKSGDYDYEIRFHLPGGLEEPIKSRAIWQVNITSTDFKKEAKRALDVLITSAQQAHNEIVDKIQSIKDKETKGVGSVVANVVNIVVVKPVIFVAKVVTAPIRFIGRLFGFGRRRR